MHMAHGTVDRCSEGRTAECCTQPAGRWDRHGGNGGVAVSPVWHFATPGVPIRAGSAGDWPCGGYRRALGADHAEDASERGARCAGVLRNQWLDDQRDRDASDRDLSLSCTRAWLSEDEIGIGTKFDSIIRLTACLAANFSKSTNSWFPTKFELSASVPG